jgi:alpha-D-ribose 1-methylphosphonate 5-triphosphate synthase subunit PhnH
MAHPVYTAAEARNRETFLALMWAFSYPGRIYTLPAGDPLDSIATTLLDLETSFFTPDATLTTQLARTSARALPPETAAYHFYPDFNVDLFEHIQRASRGSMLFPDEAATLIVGCAFGMGTTLRLTGPGIAGEQTISATLPEAFWALRAQAHFPMGWDIYLLDGTHLIGLPRSTHITIISAP